MFKNIILLSFLAGVSLVTSNPLLQALTLEPSASCPCLQQLSTTPFVIPIDTNPFQLPLIQNTLHNVNENHMPECQNPFTPCQNPVTLSQYQLPSYQNLMIPIEEQLALQNVLQSGFVTPNVNFMSNPSPCQNEIILTENQCNVCQSNPLPSNAINPFYMNSVLENPTITTIQDANTRLYNQHGVEVPINPCNVPNVVNNYIYVPSEVFMEDSAKDRYCTSNRERKEKVKKRTGRRKNKKNRKDIDDQNKNGDNENELALSNNNNTEIGKTQVEVTDLPTINDTHDVILDENINNIILNKTTGIESTLNKEKNADQNVPQTEDRVQLKEHKNEPIEYQVEMPNINTQTPSNVNYSPCTQVPQGNFYNSPCLPNNFQYVNTGIPNNANYNMLDQYLQIFTNDHNINKHFVGPLGSNSQVNARFNDKHIATDVNMYNVTKGNGNTKPKRRNSQNKSTTLKLNVNSKPQDKENFVIQDFKRKFPNIPESLVRHLIYYMKKHLQEEQNIVTNQYPLLPMNFEQFYRTPFINTPRNSNNGRRNSNKRNYRIRKPKSKNKNNSNQETSADTTNKVNNADTSNNGTAMSGKYQETSYNIEGNKIIELKNEKKLNEYVPVTKVENILVIEETNANLEPNKSKTLHQVKEKVSKGYSDSELTIKPEDTQFKVQHTLVGPETKQIITSELGKEDIVQPMPMNNVDDYYPDFTVDNHAYFLSSMEDVHLRNLEDRYHYTTDRNLKFAELNRERRKYEQNNNKNKFFRDPSANSNIFEYITTERGKYKAVTTETTTPKIEQTTEAKVQFRTPPTLEKPDFETKKMDSPKINFDDIEYKPVFTSKDTNNDKVSTYSSTKTAQYNHKEKPAKNDSEKVSERRNIETVYANSKVVKYGTNHGDTTSNIRGVTETNIPRNSKKERDEDRNTIIAYDGDSTFVYAKSIPHNF